MSFLSAVREAIAKPIGGQGHCFGCAHFCDDAMRIEAELPGLSSLSSGHASVRGQDGFCERHERLINGQRRCPSFTAQDA
jgi:hypothetical protein